MLEGTRIVQVYFRAEGPDDPRFGDEIDNDAVNDYAYDGWLPLALSPRDEHGRQHATVIGDPSLSRPERTRLRTRDQRRPASQPPSAAPSCGNAHGSGCGTSSRKRPKSAASRTTATGSVRTSRTTSSRP